MRVLPRVLLVSLALAAGPALAEDRAVVVNQTWYPHVGAVTAPDVSAYVSALASAGFAVTQGENLTNADLRRRLGALRPDAAAPGARVAVLSGQVVSSGSDTWFLGTDARSLRLETADLAGVSLSVLGELVRSDAGRAFVFLADAPGEVEVGPGLRNRVGSSGAQGPVTIVSGSGAGIEKALRALAVPGTTVERALAADRSLKLVQGDGSAVLTPKAARPVATPTPDPLAEGGRVLEGESEAWLAAATTNTVAAYEAFLGRYPGGRYADAARARVAQLRTAAPAASPAAVAEIALNLSRGERAQVQRQLTLLGQDTRGIDGIFGAATRQAISGFQRNQGLAVTGFLDRATLDRLRARAEARAGELEAEGRARQDAAAVQERAFWEDVGQVGGVAGLREYLAKYPEGRYAVTARQLLGQSAPQSRQQAWDAALKADTVQGYREIIANWPGTDLAREAESRIAVLQAGAADRDAEKALGLNQITRQMIEARLKASGLDTGAVDGVFDARTRAAIRAYQTSRNLRATGYVNETTMVRMLADTVVNF